MRRLLYLATLSMAVMLVLAPTALAQETTIQEEECITILSSSSQVQIEQYTVEEVQACEDLILNVEAGDTIALDTNPDPEVQDLVTGFFVADTFVDEAGNQVIVGENGSQFVIGDISLANGIILVEAATLGPGEGTDELTTEECAALLNDDSSGNGIVTADTEQAAACFDRLATEVANSVGPGATTEQICSQPLFATIYAGESQRQTASVSQTLRLNISAELVDPDGNGIVCDNLGTDGDQYAPPAGEVPEEISDETPNDTEMLPDTGGPTLLLPAAGLLLATGLIGFRILRRRS